MIQTLPSKTKFQKLNILDRAATERASTTSPSATTELQLGMYASRSRSSDLHTEWTKPADESPPPEPLVQARRKFHRHLGRRASHGRRLRASPDSAPILGLGDRNGAHPGAGKVLHESARQVPRHGQSYVRWPPATGSAAFRPGSQRTAS